MSDRKGRSNWPPANYHNCDGQTSCPVGADIEGYWWYLGYWIPNDEQKWVVVEVRKQAGEFFVYQMGSDRVWPITKLDGCWFRAFGPTLSFNHDGPDSVEIPSFSDRLE